MCESLWLSGFQWSNTSTELGRYGPRITTESFPRKIPQQGLNRVLEGRVRMGVGGTVATPLEKASERE